MLIATAAVLLLTASFATKTAPENVKKIKVVCIDAGHGGKDPGCHGDHTNEKDVALAISLKLGKYIEQHYPSIKVVYTRKTDVFVELNERAAIANRNHADLFICVHCNSACVRKKNSSGHYHDVCNEEANGSETYVMGLHKTEGNLEVAKRENDAVLYEDNYQSKYDLSINSDEAEIIFSTYQNLYLEQSMRFAQLCQQQFHSNAGREDKGVKQAGFLVLWKTAMPSVLIETGFLSSPSEERFLSSEKGQTHMAASIFRAFRSWKDEIEGNTITYDDSIEKMPPYVVTATDTEGLPEPVNYILHPNGVKKAVASNGDHSSGKPKPASDTSDDGPANKDTAADNNPVVYRVQILTSLKPLDDGSPELKGVKDTWHYEQKGIYKYTAGAYTSQQDAADRQGELRKQGFDQAFVVVFDKDGNRISFEEARKLAAASGSN